VWRVEPRSGIFKAVERTWIVQGERVGLTAMVREEFVARWDLYNDPALAMSLGYSIRGLDLAAPAKPPVTREHREALWEFMLTSAVAPFDIRAVEDQRLLGECSLSRITWPRASADLAIAILDPADRGRGYGSEAVILLAALAFDCYGLRRVVMRYLAVNEAAVNGVARHAEPAGGRIVGIEREAEWAYGAYQDAVTMEFLASEFQPHPATAHLRELPTKLELQG
jgi:RimJ/RimL family protein N-acetyltransferase